MTKLKIKKGDTVEIIAGDDKGKKGKVLAVFPKANKVVVEGCKMAKKAVKPSEQNQNGGFMNVETPMDASNVRMAEGA